MTTATITTMDINKIEFKARRFHVVGVFSLSIIPVVVLAETMAYGLLPFSRIFNYIIGGVGGILLGSFFIPFKNLAAVITDKTLKAPIAGGLFFSKSITVDLSEVVISKDMRDKLHGFEVSTRDGQRICVSSLFYGRKNKQRLILEIELRKARLACEKKEVAD